MALHYIEFTSVQRHVLQVDAEDENEAREAAEDIVRSGHCSGLRVHDGEKPLIIHAPFGSDTFDVLDDDQALLFQEPFSRDTDWMIDLAERLLIEAR